MTILNTLNHISICSLNVAGLFTIGIIFLYTSFNFLGAKLLQILLLLIYGCIALFYNDGNSLVSLFCFYISMELCGKYYNIHKIKYFLFIPLFVITSLIANWPFFYIAGSILLYTTIASILYIINNDKV